MSVGVLAILMIEIMCLATIQDQSSSLTGLESLIASLSTLLNQSQVFVSHVKFVYHQSPAPIPKFKIGTHS